MRSVLSTHIIKIHSISDLDFKLAKAFLGSRAVQSLSRDDTVELRKRLTILEKSRGGTQRSVAVSSEPKVAGQTKESVDDAKMKSVAQAALQKSRDNNYSELTLDDIEARAKYRKFLSTQDESPAKNLLPLIEQTLAAIQERISKIDFD